MRTRLLGAVILLAVVGTVSAGSLPAALDLQYTVKVGPAKLGTLITSLRRSGDSYEVRSETRAEGLAAILIGGSLYENCRFDVSEGSLKPLTYGIVSEARKAYKHEVRFDWTGRTISFSNGELIPMPESGYVIDNCSFPFALMLSASELSSRALLHVVGGKRIREFENIIVTREGLSTPLGTFDTLRIQQQRVGKPERKLTMWLAVERERLAVKIVEERKSRTATVVVRIVKGL
jgi:hypothetical protein